MTGLLGKYSDVVGMDVDQLTLVDYSYDDKWQYAEVKAELFLTKFTRKRCIVRKEKMIVKLVKSVNCKTQVVCGPSVLTCKGCGTSLDLLQGKKCHYCGRELDMENYDWVISGIRL